MKTRYFHSFVLSICLFAISGSLQASAIFTPYDSFPPGVPDGWGGSKAIIGTSLPDGRLLVWNGETLFIQYAVDVDSFATLATGYIGDPGFIDLVDNGTSAVLGEGFGGRIYRVDLSQAADFSAGAVVATQSHYSGVMLSDSLTLLDAGTIDFSSELIIVDISGAKVAPTTVVTKSAKYTGPSGEKTSILDKPAFSWSAAMAVDGVNGIVYVMDGATTEIRYFIVAELIQAYNNSTLMDWETDGIQVGTMGQFYIGGVADIMLDGTLLVGGWQSWETNGGIQIVDPRLDDPALAVVLDILTPAGTSDHYGVIYNPVSDSVTAMAGGQAFSNAPSLLELPVAGGLGLLALGGLLSIALRRKTQH
jgi:hypothetical protein